MSLNYKMSEIEDGKFEKEMLNLFLNTPIRTLKEDKWEIFHKLQDYSIAYPNSSFIEKLYGDIRVKCDTKLVNFIKELGEDLGFTFFSVATPKKKNSNRIFYNKQKKLKHHQYCENRRPKFNIK